VRFGFIFFARDLRRVGPLARLGEELGFDLIGLCDSPSLAYDPYVALTLAAQQTARVRLGPGVTNPQTRHPLILANLAAALEQLAPGRSFLGLGTGNSGVRHAGSRPATLGVLDGTVRLTRRLLAGEAVEFSGAHMTVQGGGRRVPILIAGSGPKSLRLAGRIADIAWVNLGVTPEVVAEGIRWVREGAEAAGRDANSVEVWAFAVGAVTDDRAKALDEVKGAAVAVAAYVLPGDGAAKRVPPPIQERVGQLLREYQYGEHLTPGRTANYHLADRLGIAEYLLDRFTIAGTADDCHAKLVRLRDIGVQRMCLSLSAAPDVGAYVRRFGERVLPALA
jgi:5,10-methylenetetrahydromethanopterin reductase